MNLLTTIDDDEKKRVNFNTVDMILLLYRQLIEVKSKFKDRIICCQR